MKFDPNSPPLRKTTVLIREQEHDITEVTTGVFEEALERLTALVTEVIDLILYGTAIVNADMTLEQKEEAYDNLQKFAIERIPVLVKKFPREMRDILSMLTGYSEEQIKGWPPDLVVERLIQEIVVNFHWISDDIKKKAAPILDLLGIKEKKEAEETETQSVNSSGNP